MCIIAWWLELTGGEEEKGLEYLINNRISCEVVISLDWYVWVGLMVLNKPGGE